MKLDQIKYRSSKRDDIDKKDWYKEWELISKAESKIILRLKQDEIVRTKLLKNEESESGRKLTFETKPNNDFKKFTDSVCVELAEQLEISLPAIKLAAMDIVEDYNVSEGMTKTTFIEIPNDADQKIFYWSMTFRGMPKISDNSVKFEGETRGESGQQDNSSQDNWRYRLFLDLVPND